MPHCRLLGKAWEVYAIASQADTIPLISIPEWDFNWQGIYDFPSLKHIPAGYGSCNLHVRQHLGQP